MLLAFAMASALLAVRNGAPGQVIDCAMTEGSALLTALTHGLHAAGQWRDEAGANLIDGGSPWYDAYETADGKWVAIGALEPQFRAELLEKLGLGADGSDDAALRATFTATFASRTRERMVRLARRQRRLLRADPVARRSAGASAQSGARRVRHHRGGCPAGTGAALLGNPERGAGGSQAGRGCTARRARLRAGADRRPARSRHISPKTPTPTEPTTPQPLALRPVIGVMKVPSVSTYWTPRVSGPTA